MQNWSCHESFCKWYGTIIRNTGRFKLSQFFLFLHLDPSPYTSLSQTDSRENRQCNSARKSSLSIMHFRQKSSLSMHQLFIKHMSKLLLVKLGYKPPKYLKNPMSAFSCSILSADDFNRQTEPRPDVKLFLFQLPTCSI